MILNYAQKANGMFVLSRKQIEEIAGMFLREYDPASLARPGAVDVEWLAEECLYLSVEHKLLAHDDSILGLTVFEDVAGVPCLDEDFKSSTVDLAAGTVLIHTWLKAWENYYRRRFTLAHEVAHWILHRSFHSPCNQKFQFRTGGRFPLSNAYVACRAAAIEGGSHELVTEYDWEEWQANSLAASILMPADVFNLEATALFRQCGHNGLGSSSVRDHIWVVAELSSKFEVSKQAVEIRLGQLGLNRRDSEFKSFRN